jgi:hypothetical protein
VISPPLLDSVERLAERYGVRDLSGALAIVADRLGWRYDPDTDEWTNPEE